MTYYRHVCEFCGWVLNEYRIWNVYPDVRYDTFGVCGLCHSEQMAKMEEPASWHGWDIGEAGA